MGGAGKKAVGSSGKSAKVKSSIKDVSLQMAPLMVALDAMIIMDSADIILEFSPAAEQIFQYKRDEIIGKELADTLIPPRYRGQYRRILADHPNGRRGTLIDKRVEFSALRQNGEEFPIELFVAKVPGEAPPVFIGTIRDMTEQKHAEAAVRANEQRWLSLIENSSEGIALLSLDAKILFISSAAAGILGYTSGEMLAIKDLSSFTHPDDRAWVGRRFGRVIKPGASASATYRARAKDGSYHWVEVVAKNAVSDPNVQGVIVNFRDVTREKQAREELAASEQRYRFVVQNASDIITVFNRRGIITYQSPSITRLLGISNVRVGGDIFKSPLVHPEDADAKARFLRKLIRAKPETEIKGEFRMRHADGNWRDLEVVGINLLHIPEVGGVMLSSRDVTERRRADMALKASEQRLLRAQRAGNVGIFDWDLINDRITYSPQAMEIFGLESGNGGAMSYQSSIEILHREDRARVKSEAESAIKDHREVKLEYRVVRPDKSVRWLQIVAESEYGLRGRAMHVLGVIVDITERKLIDEQRDEFIAVASHELKTPVTSLKIYTAMLERKLKRNSDDATLSAISAIGSQVDRLNILVRDLLDAGRIETDQLKLKNTKFDYDKLVDETIKLVRLTTDRHTIHKIGRGRVRISADRDRLSQVLTNLLSNAIKYSPEPGEIRVSVRSTSEDLITCVSDHGLGIPKGNQAHLFERFVRVSDPRAKDFPGLGLGLYITARIIDQMGGKIWVKSSAGKGSKFYFSLPLAN